MKGGLKFLNNSFSSETHFHSGTLNEREINTIKCNESYNCIDDSLSSSIMDYFSSLKSIESSNQLTALIDGNLKKQVINWNSVISNLNIQISSVSSKYKRSKSGLVCFRKTEKVYEKLLTNSKKYKSNNINNNIEAIIVGKLYPPGPKYNLNSKSNNEYVKVGTRFVHKDKIKIKPEPIKTQQNLKNKDVCDKQEKPIKKDSNTKLKKDKKKVIPSVNKENLNKIEPSMPVSNNSLSYINCNPQYMMFNQPNFINQSTLLPQCQLQVTPNNFFMPYPNCMIFQNNNVYNNMYMNYNQFANYPSLNPNYQSFMNNTNVNQINYKVYRPVMNNFTSTRLNPMEH